MPWWNGLQIHNAGTQVNVSTLVEAINNAVQPPARAVDFALRVPVSGVFKIKGVGDVVTGRVERGLVKAGDKVRSSASGATGSVVSIETHHRRLEHGARAGDIVGINLRGLCRRDLPEVGDVLVR